MQSVGVPEDSIRALPASSVARFRCHSHPVARLLRGHVLHGSLRMIQSNDDGQDVGLLLATFAQSGRIALVSFLKRTARATADDERGN